MAAPKRRGTAVGRKVSRARRGSTGDAVTAEAGRASRSGRKSASFERGEPPDGNRVSEMAQRIIPSRRVGGSVGGGGTTRTRNCYA